jgi:hypothetical protein
MQVRRDFFEIRKLATLTIAKQNLLFGCLQEFELLRKSVSHIAALSFEKAAQPIGFALS